MRNDNCRLGPPHIARNETVADRNNCAFIKRSPGSGDVDQYSSYLLIIWDASMDIQVCVDSKVEIYLAKYLSKAETRIAYSSSTDQTPREQSTARKVGVIKAIYDLTGYHKHQTSLDVIYVDMTMPHIEQRGQLKPVDALFRLEPGSTDIYTRTHLEKYQYHDSKVLHMTTKEYFLIYILNFTQRVVFMPASLTLDAKQRIPLVSI
ncbi:hypothetical protein MFLAVUS_008558 [Mucor flavus]|uniref:Uncharacterized protein n=1 Tax=Mucor flavus TaxID=439312 RepID=A0ABP9Z7L5_9FUNG